MNLIDFPIPANDDTIKTVELLMGVIGEGIEEAQKTIKKGKQDDKPNSKDSKVAGNHRPWG